MVTRLSLTIGNWVIAYFTRACSSWSAFSRTWLLIMPRFSPAAGALPHVRFLEYYHRMETACEGRYICLPGSSSCKLSLGRWEAIVWLGIKSFISTAAQLLRVCRICSISLYFNIAVRVSNTGSSFFRIRFKSRRLLNRTAQCFVKWQNSKA